MHHILQATVLYSTVVHPKHCSSRRIEDRRQYQLSHNGSQKCIHGDTLLHRDGSCMSARLSARLSVCLFVYPAVRALPYRTIPHTVRTVLGPKLSLYLANLNPTPNHPSIRSIISYCTKKKSKKPATCCKACTLKVFFFHH